MEQMPAHREVQRNMLDITQHSRGQTQDLLELQREHRIDIMALFDISKKTAHRLGNFESGTPNERTLLDESGACFPCVFFGC